MKRLKPWGPATPKIGGDVVLRRDEDHPRMYCLVAKVSPAVAGTRFAEALRIEVEFDPGKEYSRAWANPSGRHRLVLRWKPGADSAAVRVKLYDRYERPTYGLIGTT